MKKRLGRGRSDHCLSKWQFGQEATAQHHEESTGNKLATKSGVKPSAQMRNGLWWLAESMLCFQNSRHCRTPKENIEPQPRPLLAYQRSLLALKSRRGLGWSAKVPPEISQYGLAPSPLQLNSLLLLCSHILVRAMNLRHDHAPFITDNIRDNRNRGSGGGKKSLILQGPVTRVLMKSVTLYHTPAASGFYIFNISQQTKLTKSCAADTHHKGRESSCSSAHCSRWPK